MFLTECVPQGDSQLETARFQAAACKNVDGLLERGTLTVVKESELPPGASVIGGRFVYILKSARTRGEGVKRRHVAQGYRDKTKLCVVQDLATLRQRSTRILASTSAVMGFWSFSHDITQAYLQSQERFTRQFYLRPRPGDRHLFDINEGEPLRSVRCCGRHLPQSQPGGQVSKVGVNLLNPLQHVDIDIFQLRQLTDIIRKMPIQPLAPVPGEDAVRSRRPPQNALDHPAVTAKRAGTAQKETHEAPAQFAASPHPRVVAHIGVPRLSVEVQRSRHVLVVRVALPLVPTDILQSIGHKNSLNVVGVESTT